MGNKSHSSPTQVAFRLIDNRPFVQVKVNGITGQFILDSGGINGFDLSFAKRANIALTDSFNIQGAGNGTQLAWRGGSTNILISNTQITTSSSSPVIVDLQALRDSLGLPFLDGVIGAELFREYAISINYPERKLTFYEPGQAPTEGYQSIPFEFFRNQIPLVMLSVDGHEGQFTVDTGDRSSLTIFPEFYEETQLGYDLGELKMTGYGVGGPIMAREFVLREARLGEAISLISVKTRVPDHSSGSWANNDHAGNIGSALIKGYEIIFDYEQQQLLMKKVPELTIDEFVYSSANFDSTVAWYLKHFPFEVTGRTDSSVTVQYQQAKIKFLNKPNYPTLSTYKAQRANKEPNGVFKFGIDIPNPEEMYQEFLPKPDVMLMGRLINFWGKKMFLVRDPEGNVLQLFEAGQFWKNSFYALITDSEGQYQAFLDFVNDLGMAEHSNFNNDSTGVKQQNFDHGDIKIELLKLQTRAEEAYNGVGASGIQLDDAYNSLSKNQKPPLRHHSAGINTKNGLLVFGGTSANNWTGHFDTWLFKDGKWNKSTAIGPSPRSSHSLFSSGKSDAVYLFGGWDANQQKEDFWKFEDDEWSLVSETTPLGKRSSPGVAYDKKNDRHIFFGGCGDNGKMYADTWSYKNGEWKLLQENSAPGASCRAQMAYDEVNETVLLFGGSSLSDKTWLLEGDEWKALEVSGPGPRYNHMMTSDIDRNKIVLFGGSMRGGKRFNDLWEWDGSQWTQIAFQSGPEIRDMSVMQYNPEDKLTYLIGGRTPKTQPINDMWTWNGKNWNKIY